MEIRILHYIVTFMQSQDAHGPRVNGRTFQIALTEERRGEILSGSSFALEKEIKESYTYSAPVEL